MEGVHRPGHFRGVATVVTKLFAAVRPDVAVFGRKDLQQLAIIRRMTTDLDLGVRIVGLDTVREGDGLALSSRNVRLSADDRVAAVCIWRGICAARAAVAAGQLDAQAVGAVVHATIEAEPRARVEYVDVVDADTLQPATVVGPTTVVAVAAWFDGVRLIDNATLLA
jgi:pantoate--beta-alanine ligase